MHFSSMGNLFLVAFSVPGHDARSLPGTPRNSTPAMPSMHQRRSPAPFLVHILFALKAS
jgi:hypothetical protein